MHLWQSSENALCLPEIDMPDGFFDAIGGRNALICRKWAGGCLNGLNIKTPKSKYNAQLNTAWSTMCKKYNYKNIKCSVYMYVDNLNKPDKPRLDKQTTLLLPFAACTCTHSWTLAWCSLAPVELIAGHHVVSSSSYVVSKAKEARGLH